MSLRCCTPVRSFLFLGFLSVLLSSAAPSQEQNKKLFIAVLDFVTRGGLSAEEGLTLSDNFTSLLVSTGDFVVVDRDRIKEILKEQSLQATGICSDKECVVEIGKILKVQKMFSGTIGRVGKTYSINIQSIDVATAQIQATETRQYAGEVDDLLSSVIPEMAQKIAQKLLGKDVKVGAASGGSSWLWYVGGAALIGGGASAYLLLNQKKSTSPTSSTTSDLPGFGANWLH